MGLLSISESQANVSTSLSYLSTLVSMAESHFWSGGAFQFAQLGAVTDDPFTVSTDMCATAETLVDRILDNLADMTGETKGAWDWNASKNAIYSTNMSAVYTRISQIMEDISRATTGAPVDFDVRTDLAVTLATLYAQGEAALQNALGPYFPGVRTAFWPIAGAVAIQVEEDTDKLILTLLDDFDINNGGSPIGWNDDGSQNGIEGWNKISVGDILRIDTLDVSGLTETYTGYSYEVTEVDDTGGSEHIEVEAIGVPAPNPDPIIGVSAANATIFGENFRIRKIKSA